MREGEKLGQRSRVLAYGSGYGILSLSGYDKGLGCSSTAYDGDDQGPSSIASNDTGPGVSLALPRAELQQPSPLSCSLGSKTSFFFID